MKIYTFHVPMDDVGAVDFSLHANSREDAVGQAREEFRRNRAQLELRPEMRSPKFLSLSVFIDPDSISERHITSVEEYG
jgi:hypothetical protein